MEKLGLNLGYLLVQILNFAIIFIVLRAWVYKPILALLDKRRKGIQQGLEDARVAAEARASAEEQARAILAEAQATANLRVREASERAEAAAHEIQAQAEAQAAKVREEALTEAGLERDRILADLRGQIAALAMAAAQKIIGETLNERRQHVLIDEFFSGVVSGKVVVLEDSKIEGTAAQIISALPLSPAEKETIEKNVLAKIGNKAAVEFRVNPSILGGLIVRVGDKVLDGSVLSQLETLRQNLR